jgi:putative ABC transport system ATP-binding protein
MPLIELRNVHKTYNVGPTVVHALRGVTLDVDGREFVAVVGPSGSGKSTLLNLIATIDEPTEGTVSVKGREIARLSDDARTEMRNALIGYVFQRFNLVPVLSAIENVMLPLELQGVARRDARQRAAVMLEDVGLAEYAGHRPDHLSGGQQQRVAIARALVTNPAVVIADEPTANLDSATSQRILELMRALNRQHDTTFIFSTHDDRLLRYVDRLIHLTDGQITSASRTGLNAVTPSHVGAIA